MIKSKKRSASDSQSLFPASPVDSQTVTIELSPEAKANLEKLQLRSLDRRGRQPEPSQVIEGLINAAAIKEPDAPYPA